MSFISDAFQIFLQKISLPEAQLAAAQRSNNALRSFLENDEYFGGLLLDSFLNGSYARRTAVQPIKDVDIIVVVDTDWMKDDPGRAMESLRRKLAQRYDRYRTRHSVRRLVHSRGSGRLRMAARPRWRARATHFNVKATPRGTPAISTEGAINTGECGLVS